MFASDHAKMEDQLIEWREQFLRKLKKYSAEVKEGNEYCELSKSARYVEFYSGMRTNLNAAEIEAEKVFFRIF